MATDGKSGAVRFAFSICVLGAGAMLALRCGGRHEADPAVELRQSALTTENSTWWRVWNGGTTFAKSVAALSTVSRGTEIFSAYEVMGFKNVGAYRTLSNIELKSIATASAGTTTLDNASAAAASLDGGTTVDVFWRFADQTMGSKTWNGTSFVAPANPLPFGQFRAGLGAAGKTNRIDVFGVGLDGNIWQAWRGTSSWNGWSNIGSPTGGLASLQPAVAWLPSTVLQVFAVKASDGTVWTRRNENGPWTAWTSLGGNVSSGIAVTFSGSSRVDIFAVHAGTGVIDTWRSDNSGSTWTAGTSFAGPPGGIMTTTIDGVTRYVAPTAIARSEGAIDLFVRDVNGHVQLMTIRPTTTLSGSKERSIATAPSACENRTGLWGENTAAATKCTSNFSYQFLSYSALGILRVPEQSCFPDSPPGSNCTVPSGVSIKNCAPYEIRFSNNPLYGPPGAFPNGFNVANLAGLTIEDYGMDNQIVRLSDSSVVALNHHQIRTQAPMGPGCSVKSKTSGDLIYLSTATECGTNWTAKGVIDVCKQIDPQGTNACFNFNDCAEGAGGDRPEMVARGMDLYVTEFLKANGSTWVGPANTLLVKSTNQGQTWTSWFTDTKTAVQADPPLQITTVGEHVLLYGRVVGQNQLAIWSVPTTAPANPATQLVPSADFSYLDLNERHNVLSIAQAGSSADGDYVRVVYTTMMSGAQAVKTGLVRINSDQTITALTDSFTTISGPVTGSILYPTLIEADRVDGPSNRDERPPVVLFWAETTNTPSPVTGCFHGNYCNWGTISIKAKVFRGGSQSQTYVVDTAHAQSWKGGGDYVHGASRHSTSAGIDRFFIHWNNESSSAALLPMARLIDVIR